MKTYQLLSSVALSSSLLLFCGCASTGESSRAAAAPTTDVEAFHDGAVPSKPYKEIGKLTDDGKEAEQQEIEAKMIKRAKKMGANAILFEKPKASGVEAAPFSFGKFENTFLYKATVVVYQ
jgi:hypothetical protein